MHYIYNSYSLHYQVKPESVSLHYFMVILVRWFYFFNWKNKSSFQQLFIKICYLKSLTFSLHLKRTLNNSQHINSDDTYMWIMSSLVLWNKMLTTKLHIFLSSEKYLIIITTPFLKWWYRKGMPRNFSLTSQIFFCDSCYVFVNRLCYCCYSPNIPSNNSKVRNQDAWSYWF